MKIILTHEVSGLGAAGDVVDVKDGYARNYLVPRKLAIRWTKGGEKDVEQIRRARKIHEIHTIEQANQVKAQLEPSLRFRHPGRHRFGDQGFRWPRGRQAPHRARFADQDAGRPRDVGASAPRGCRHGQHRGRRRLKAALAEAVSMGAASVRMRPPSLFLPGASRVAGMSAGFT
jgi:hypothetical protein